MNDFREALAWFGDAVRQEGERTGSPGLQAILDRERRAVGLRLRWATAAVVLIALSVIPAYWSAQRKERAAEQDRADSLLLEKVNAGLSRSIPRAMAPLLGQAPTIGDDR